MTQTVAEIRHTVARTGFANPLTLGVLVEDVDYLLVYADDVELQEGVDYSVLGIGDPDGVEITIIGGEDIDEWVGVETFTVLFDPPLSQGAALALGGGIGRPFEAALDQQNRQTQAIADRVDRAIKMPVFYEGDITLPAPIDSGVMQWDEDTQRFVWATLASAGLAPGLPGGGAEGRALTKASSTSYDVEWVEVLKPSDVGASVQPYAPADNVAQVSAWAPVAAPDFIRTAGYSSAGDGGGALYKKVVSEPSHAGKFSITLAGGSVVWFELAEAVVNPRMFGAVGNGTADDTTPLQNAVDCVFGYLGGTLDLTAGTFGVTARIYCPASSKKATLRGRGPGASIIKRISDFNASVMEFRDSDDCIWEEFSIDANHATYSNGNHGFVVYNSERPIVRNVNVRDWKNSAILVYSLAGAKGGARIEGCRVDGLGPALVGILISGMYASGMFRCSAYGVAGAGEGYGLELKNECDGCYITEGYAEDCLIGIVFGQDIGTTAVVNSKATGITRSCNFGFVSGYGENNDIDVLVIMTGAASGQQAIDLQNSSKDNTVRATIKDVPASRNAVRIRSGCTDNLVEIRAIDTLPSSATVIRFDNGAERNKVVLRKLSNPTIPTTGYSGLVTDSSTSNDNSFSYDGYPRTLSKTIASGAVTLSDPHTQFLILDTEASAATDDLDTITGAAINGQVITLGSTANARDVVVKHNTGNILLNGAADFTLDGAADSLTLRYSRILSKWSEIGRGINA